MILANRSIRIGAGAIDLHLSGALDNRQGIAGSGGTLANRGTLRATGDLSASATTVLNAGLMEAGERLSVLGGDSVVNTRGGILAGRDVDVTALDGDLINERTVTHVDGTASRLTFTLGLADSAARIEALGSLSLSAGRDLYNLGGVISAIADLDLSAGRDLVIAAAEERDDSLLRTRRRTHRIESVTPYGGAVSAGGDLTAVAGQDLSVIGSRVEAGGDATLLAGNDLTLSSAADASHEDERDRRRGKKLHQETRTVRQQAAEVEAGGDLTLAAGQDLTLVASTASAGREAYLYAGRDVALLAQTDQDAFLYDKKSKGGFGSKRTRHDEVNVVTQVGSSVSAGTDLTVESGGDQRYQVANLKSGQDLTLDSGGGIAFEGVKDLEQAIHEKSDSVWAWTSARGKGKTDETLRQSELIAGGELAIRAAQHIRIDVPEVNAQTVSQTITALAEAEPQLAWLKQMERRGDIDWQRVKEVHERFQYSQSGMGPGLTLVTAIVVTALTWGTVSAWLGTGAAAGSAMAVAVPATATAAGVSAGWANAALTATVTSMASNAAIHTLNSGGDLGKALENTFSERAMKGYLTSAVVAGLMTGLVDRYFKGEGGSGAGVEGDVSQAGQATASTSASGFNLDTAAGIGQFAAYQGTRALVSAGVDTAINGGNFEEKLGAALTLAAVHTVSAVAFHEIGDLKLQDGSIEKVAVKALVGGLISQAATGDFATGALAAGANEALVKHLADLADHDPQLTGMASQLVGAVSSALSGGDPNLASDIALSDTQYNHELHKDAAKVAEQALEHCKSRPEQCDPSFVRLTTGDVLAAMEAEAQHGVGFENAKPEALAFVNNYMFALSPGLKDFLYVPTESEQQRLDFMEDAELAGTLLGGAASALKNIGTKGLAAATKDSGPISNWIASLVGKSGEQGGSVAGELTSIAQKQLDKKFKHASDFGVVTTKKNPETIAQFESAIKAHMDSPSTMQQGTYGFVKDSKVFFNSTTNNVVVIDSTGSFVTGFKLAPGTPQFNNFIKNGVLR